MATDTVERFDAHVRGITVTALSALLGIAAAFGSYVTTSGPTETAVVFALVAAIAVQFPVLQFTGIKTDFSAKDYLYVAFMTFALWFVTLTILFTAGVTL
ncbi:EMC6-like membrane protein [Halomarina oriensis]|uniref:Uncharacterized protein n=1 Tax=Halomarina oriensis TaxID=671145 RepID=A0A6B0GLB2_9EURY|nr:hypothetical protein [Halomarina oriensis]MWG35544.1 hypothetical protein [Halomarina oriensis]